MSECRRLLLMRQFTEEPLDIPDCLHLCCDICASLCMCDNCNVEVVQTEQFIPTCSSHHESAHTAVKVPSESIKLSLKQQLKELRQKLSSQTHSTALVGVELCTGLTDQVIENITTNCLCIQNESDIMVYGVTSEVYCTAIFECVKNVLK